jgi:hypothetical protein
MKLIKAKEVAKKLPYCRIIIPDKSFDELEKDLEPNVLGLRGPKISTIRINNTRFYRRSDFNDRFGEGI